MYLRLEYTCICNRGDRPAVYGPGQLVASDMVCFEAFDGGLGPGCGYPIVKVGARLGVWHALVELAVTVIVDVDQPVILPLWIADLSLLPVYVALVLTPSRNGKFQKFPAVYFPPLQLNASTAYNLQQSIVYYGVLLSVSPLP